MGSAGDPEDRALDHRLEPSHMLPTGAIVQLADFYTALIPGPWFRDKYMQYHAPATSSEPIWGGNTSF
ncbi:hypothetical protein NLI96_g8559 [Meripilus lineatus]|uniref:Uncharacterized protein n=1 Tax=Meripilus lineatus TaxID=2056292 RepID=A0AAD5V2A7_9APHY|nr:hypothetical protein NLI96_g8559 [Physisporinus lineatus]